MSSQEDRAQIVVEQKWTPREVARELAVILSASAGIIGALMLLKGLQSII